MAREAGGWSSFFADTGGRLLSYSGGCGLLTETRKLSFLPRARALHMVMASAAAVPSSSSEALDMAMPVRSVTTVWKLSSDSSLQALSSVHKRRRGQAAGLLVLSVVR